MEAFVLFYGMRLVSKQKENFQRDDIPFDLKENLKLYFLTEENTTLHVLNPFVPTVPTFAVRETASLGIMGAPEVPLSDSTCWNGGEKWVKSPATLELLQPSGAQLPGGFRALLSSGARLRVPVRPLKNQ